jgi:biopolymer transport protein TolQ
MTPNGGSFWELILVASPFAKFILAILGVMSLLSWAIIIDKLVLMARIKGANRGMAAYRWKQFEPRSLSSECRRFSQAFAAKAYLHVHREIIDRGGADAHDSELVGREFARAAANEISRAERFLPFLATCSSAGPFLGLLGTVWGIIVAFQRIGIWGSANIAVVAPGIAEALVATALGLFVAIPALVAYNFISTWLRKEAERTETFADDLVFAVDRYSARRAAEAARVIP